MHERELWKITDIPAPMQGGENQIVVPARGEGAAGAIEGEAGGIGAESLLVEARGFAPEAQAGADWRPVRPRGGGATGGDERGGAEVAQGEEAEKLAGPFRRRRFELGYNRSTRGSQSRMLGEAIADGGEESRTEDVVIVDEDDHGTAGFTQTREAGSGEAGDGFENDANAGRAAGGERQRRSAAVVHHE